MDTGTIQQQSESGKTYYVKTDILEEARMCFDALTDFRNRRKRSRDYYRGKPNETMTDSSGNVITEDSYIQGQGRIPYKSNMFSPMMRNMKGQFRSLKAQRIAVAKNRQDTDAAEMMSEAITTVNKINRTDDIIDVDAMEENLMGGMYGWKGGYWWNEGELQYEVTIDNIDPTRIFFNQNLKDRRLNQLRIIGEIHDLTLPQIVSQFAIDDNGEYSEELATFIEEQYQSYKDQKYAMTTVGGFAFKDQVNFYMSIDPNMCRLVEVWKQEYRWQNFVHDPNNGGYDILDITQNQVNQINAMRMTEAAMAGIPLPLPIRIVPRYAPMWRVYYMTPTGVVLKEQDTPYWHMRHPYRLGFATLVDGEIWGLIEELIDQQRLVNRLITNIDFAFGASMKGVIFVHEDAIPEGVSLETFAENITKFNGVIKFTGKANTPIPQQVLANAIPAGMFNWLGEIQRQFQDNSGVQSAQQGQTPTSGTPSSLYQAQIAQSQLNNRDFFDGFYATRRDRDLMAIQLIAQYYDEPRWLVVDNKKPDGSNRIQYNPKLVRNIQWDVVVTDAPDSPNLRQLSEDFLAQLLQTNRLTFRQFLQVSSNPKADMLLQLLDKTDQAMRQMTPEQQQQLMLSAQQGNPDALAMVNQAQ